MTGKTRSSIDIRVALLLSLAFVLRIAAIFLLGRHKNPDLWEYNELALNILHGKGYVISNFNTDYYSYGYPGYPVFLVFSHILLKSNYFLFTIAQVILSLASFYLIYLIVKKILGEKPALVYLFLTATHPGLIVYATRIHEINLVILLICFIVWLIASLDWSRAWDNIFLGCMIGIGTLTRPTLIFFLPAYLVYLRLRSVKTRDLVKVLTVMLAGAFLVMLPWILRNYNIHKRCIFFTTTSAEHFWRGNSRFSSGTGLTTDNKAIIEAAPKEFMAKIYTLGEIGQYDLFYKDTFAFIKSDPAFFMKMLFKKVFYFWWFSPQTGLWYPRIWAVIYTAYYTVIFSLFALGIALSLIRMRGYQRALISAILVLFVFVSFSNSLYYVDTRHRWAIEPLMLIFSAYSITELYEILKRRCKNAPRENI